MKILIIEDEPLVANDLLKTINQLEPAAQVLAIIPNVTGAKNWFANNVQPDLIFSDIQLSDGVSFEIFEQNQQITCPIIFTTAYDAYAIRAFKLNSIDYLLKPIDEQDLAKALAKYRSFRLEESNSLKELILHLTQEPRKYKERFLSQQRNSLVPVRVDEIAFFHKEELIFIHTVGGEKLLSDQSTLDDLESLVDPSLFFRVNRQYLVHLQSVARVKTTHKGLSVQLKPPFAQELDLSREKATAFKQWLG